jgi:hypothetical protein
MTEVATKTCSACKRVIYKALFPSLKHSECRECSAQRRKQYNKRFARDPRLKWRNNLLFGRKDHQFEWEKHIDLQEIN